MTPEMRKKAAIVGKDSMKCKIVEMMEKQPDRSFSIDDVHDHLESIGINTSRDTVKNCLCVLCGGRYIYRLFVGAYRYKQQGGERIAVDVSIKQVVEADHEMVRKIIREIKQLDNMHNRMDSVSTGYSMACERLRLRLNNEWKN